MSTRLGLFYADKLGNCVHCTFIFAFFVLFHKGSFAHSYVISNIINTNNLHRVVWFQLFLCNINNYMSSSNYFYFIIVICLHIVIWFQVTNGNK